jgi:hypothetical protein
VPAPTGTAAGEFGYWTSWGATPTAPTATPPAPEPAPEPTLEPVDAPAVDPEPDPESDATAPASADEPRESTAASELDAWCAQRPTNPICEF